MNKTRLRAEGRVRFRAGVRLWDSAHSAPQSNPSPEANPRRVLQYETRVSLRAVIRRSEEDRSHRSRGRRYDRRAGRRRAALPSGFSSCQRDEVAANLQKLLTFEAVVFSAPPSSTVSIRFQGESS